MIGHRVDVRAAMAVTDAEARRTQMGMGRDIELKFLEHGNRLRRLDHRVVAQVRHGAVRGAASDIELQPHTPRCPIQRAVGRRFGNHDGACLAEHSRSCQIGGSLAAGFLACGEDKL
jgi:hypothetical protein